MRSWTKEEEEEVEAETSAPDRPVSPHVIMHANESSERPQRWAHTETNLNKIVQNWN